MTFIQQNDDTKELWSIKNYNSKKKLINPLSIPLGDVGHSKKNMDKITALFIKKSGIIRVLTYICIKSL